MSTISAEQNKKKLNAWCSQCQERIALVQVLRRLFRDSLRRRRTIRHIGLFSADGWSGGTFQVGRRRNVSGRGGFAL